MATSIITPKRGKNSITKGAKLISKKLGEEDLVSMEGGKIVGDYNGEELPATVQVRRIRYSLGKGRYLMLDDNGKEFSDEDLQDFVRRSYLTYEKGPDTGKLITTADPFNRADPFFNHTQLSVKLNEGNGKLDADVHAKDKLLLSGLRASNEFASSKDNSRSGATRYIISDKEQEAKLLSEDRKRKIDSVKLFSGLTDAKKLVIAKIMNLGVNESNDRDTIDNAIYNAITSTRQNSEGVSLQQLFINICNMNSRELNLRFLIASARGNGVIKPSKSGFTFRGNRIASTDSGLYDYFNKNENHETLLLLEEAMGRVYSVPDEDEVQDLKPTPKKAKKTDIEDGKVDPITE